MAYVTVYPRSNRGSLNTVRVRFNKKKMKSSDTFSYSLVIFLSKDIMSDMNIAYGDRLNFSISDNDEKEWNITKSSDEKGFLFSKNNNICLTWYKFVPDKKFLNKTSVVNHSLNDKKNELLINI